MEMIDFARPLFNPGLNFTVRPGDHWINELRQGDSLELLETIPDNLADTILTSPPYWSLRSYLPNDHPDKPKEIGTEPTLEEYIERLLKITAQLYRILKPTGTLYWNHGDSYGGSGQVQGCGAKRTGVDQRPIDAFVTTRPPSRNYTSKCLTMQGVRLVQKMIEEQGWILRARIPWIKQFWNAQGNKVVGTAMPMPHRDRVAYSWEEIFMLTKRKDYYYDWVSTALPNTENSDVIRPLPGCWYIRVEQSKINNRMAHFAKFPAMLAETVLRLSCPTKICSNCGVPYRVVGKFGDSYATRPGKTSKYFLDNAPVISDGITKRKVRPFEGMTIEKQCNCDVPAIPGLIFDPFAGSGTVLWVAKRLDYRYAGIELNKNYYELAKDKIADTHQQLELL